MIHLCLLSRGWRQDGRQPGQEEHLGKGAEGQQLIHGMYLCSMDVAFHLSACQLLAAPAAAPNPYPGPGKGVKKMGREQRGGCCLENSGCWWQLHVAGPCTGGGRRLLTTCAHLFLTEVQRDMGTLVNPLHQVLPGDVMPSSQQP